MKTICKRRCSIIAAEATALLVAVLLSGVARAEAQDPYFTMNVITNAAAGKSVLAGRYAAAIDKIDVARGGTISRFFAANNLCVAQVKSGELAGAAQSCDLAVTAIREAVEGLRPGRHSAPLEFAYRRYLAIALSNRGVVRAVTGRPVLARADFAEAMNLGTRVRSPEINLVRLGSVDDGSA